METLKVSTKSNPAKVAGALVNVLKESDRVVLQAVGAGAINQTMKAIAIGRGFVAPSGIELVCIPSFVDIEINEEKRTAMKLVVEKRS
ncbi:MAG: stage V sporulation protein S [Erysipelotrichaceae bacterium]|nr:stage V sporulation protein S [Erysipelotrichaceae bacterium]MBQ9987022.1 stage V sporulation protein S [Erysipelotrichales bacterium]MBR3693163.1 stage V sporulation protein S [Erysipelotrichales bacterium]